MFGLAEELRARVEANCPTLREIERSESGYWRCKDECPTGKVFDSCRGKDELLYRRRAQIRLLNWLVLTYMSVSRVRCVVQNRQGFNHSYIR